MKSISSLTRIVMAFLFPLTLPLVGQVDPGTKRPKVGLVLSGGGARGFAHIGVLEWLEEHRIPVDYIAGTSIGGLIGGLYAMGMKPAQMRDLLNRIDWDEALRGTPSYEQSVLRRKQDRREYPGLQLGWDKGFRLGAGLNGGHFVRVILDRVALPYWQVRDFDELPIPFRCVAADLVTAKTVVLRDGGIAEALRATIAVAGVFTPVQRGDALLIDGGILNNLPTDVVKEMGADVIIAVNAGTPLRTGKDLQSMIGILDQASNLAVIQNLRRNLLLADFVLTPDLGQYTAANFTASEALAQAGYGAAASEDSELLRFQIGHTEWARYSATVSGRVRRNIPVPQALVVQAPTTDAANAIRERLQHHLGRTLIVDDLEDDLTGILGWGRYSGLNYDLRVGNDPSRGPELIVRAEPLIHGAPLMRVGLGMQGDQTQQVEVNLRTRVTVFDIGGYGSEVRVNASLGTTLLYGMEYYRPLGKSRFFVAPRAYASRATTNLSATKDTVASYRRSSAGAGIDLGYGVLSQTDEVRLGYEVRHDHTSILNGTPALPVYRGATNFLSLRWQHDGQDSAIIPRRGIQFTLRGSWFLNSATSARDFPQAEFAASAFHPIDDEGSIFTTAAAGTTFNRTAPPGREFTLGGPQRLNSYGLHELRGSHYALAGAGYLRQVTGGNLLKLYAVGILQGGRVFHPHSDNRAGIDATVGVVADTLLGPILVGAAVGDAGHRKLFISVGRIF